MELLALLNYSGTSLLIIFVFPACSNIPLSSQENVKQPVSPKTSISSSTPTTAIIESGTQSLIVIEGSSRSPLATPTATRKPVQVVTAVATSLPVATATPTPTAIPPTPTQVEPTATSAPVIATPNLTIKVVSEEPLLSPEILKQMGAKENDTIWVDGWPAEDEIILRTTIPTSTFWRLSKERTRVEPLVEWSSVQTIVTSGAAVEELRSFNKSVDYAVVSPDGQWATWGGGKTLLIKRLGVSESPINLLGVKYEQFENGVGTLGWSPDSKRIAYTVDNGNESRYEIRIIELEQQKVKIASLWDTAPHQIAWSPNSQYIAFSMLEQPQSGVTHSPYAKENLTELRD